MGGEKERKERVITHRRGQKSVPCPVECGRERAQGKKAHYLRLICKALL